MGFRSTFVSQDYHKLWPQWFIDRWKEYVYFDSVTGIIASSMEAKTYVTWYKLEQDIQKTVTDSPFILVYLHECGGITHVTITKDDIKYHEPISYEKSNDGQGHGDWCSKKEGVCCGFAGIPKNKPKGAT